MAASLPIAMGEAGECVILPQMATRHGLIAGATGTGKTVTLQLLIERFSQIGVPVFAVDIKGDLAGISQPGTETARLTERLQQLNLPVPQFAATPVTFWDIFGEQGHPLRTTVSELGPLLLARLLNLNDTQTGVINIAFQVADDQGLLLLDFKDLRALVQYLGEQAKTLKLEYGNISAASVGAIQRSLLALEQQGAAQFLGEPALDLHDLLQTDSNGKGVVNILAASRLIQSPQLYAMTLLWLLSDLFEQLPEVGDLDQPKLVLVFDEAHLLFKDAPKVLLDKIEQVVRLIRSKGVGLYFCSQTPMDIPSPVLSQLANRIQHALRAFTPADLKAVKATAQTFRPNPQLDIERAIGELRLGEALISCLDAQGSPTIVQRAFMLPPASQIGAITPAQRQQILQTSLLYGHYEAVEDRESAYELLKQRTEQAIQAAEAANRQAELDQAAAVAAKEQAKAEARQAALLQKQLEQQAKSQAKAEAQMAQEREKLLLDLAAGAAGALGGSTGKRLARGLLGGILGYGTHRRRG